MNIHEQVIYYDGNRPAYVRSHERGAWIRGNNGYVFIQEDRLPPGKKATWQEVFVPFLHTGKNVLRLAKVARCKTATQAGQYYRRTLTLGKERLLSAVFGGLNLDSRTHNLSLGEAVIVGEPGENDSWQHSFQGIVVGVHDSHVTIQDQEDSVFDVGYNNIKKEDNIS